MQIMWFKRDLRIEDNAALMSAAQNGPVLPLYILEPALWAQPDMSKRQYIFLKECLRDLDLSLQKLGHRLVIKIGHAVRILQNIHAKTPISALWSHQETWNGWTYERDKQVKSWAQNNNIPWHEPVQNGVIRCLKNRDGWSARWIHLMKQPLCFLPETSVFHQIPTEDLPNPDILGLMPDGCTIPQQGGRLAGLKTLSSFLYERGEGYTKEMSSPVTAYDSCSRLSPHLAFGTLSIRETFQAAEHRALEIKNMPYGTKGKWSSAIRSFSGRLRWHCHFIQKLEDEPRIEFENMHPAYDGIRENDFNEDYFYAWKTGQTGYPMVDACMRALQTTGWLNFRMRAMLMSFASYHLWLHWQRTSLHLAQLFTDYEPGIHYSQVQMQSGTTGINSIRIYNPLKQGIDQDPDGIFIRQWIPELAEIDSDYIHTPWKRPSQAQDYPPPIVDVNTARKAAADKLYGLRKSNEHKQTAQKIVSKHGSRKSGIPKVTDSKKNTKQKKDKKTNLVQGELPF